MRSRAVFWVLAGLVSVPRPAGAQGPPPPIPFVALDLHANVAMFPSNQLLADSRGLTLEELPGTGFGGDLTLTLYPLKWHGVTFGIGGHLMGARSKGDAAVATSSAAARRAVTETFTYLAPQISFNFGTGAGWSYLSAGISRSKWSIAADGADPLTANQQGIKTIDYGGGARWFAKPHLAFSFDVRFYAVNPSTPADGFPSGPRSSFVVIGAGISVK